MVQSRAEVGFLPPQVPVGYVDDFKAWMHGPSAHEERVAGLKVSRDNAARTHESMKSDIRNELYELKLHHKPLEDVYKQQCTEITLVNEEVHKSMHDLKALEQQLHAAKVANQAYHANINTNSYYYNNMASTSF